MTSVQTEISQQNIGFDFSSSASCRSNSTEIYLHLLDGSVQFCTDIHAAQRMNPNDFSELI